MVQAHPPAVHLRPARADDLGFAASVYLRAAGEALQRAVALDPDQQAALLLSQWNVAETCIIVADGLDVGWIQGAPAAAAVLIRNFCVDPDYQRRGIGRAALGQVIDAAGRRGEAVTLAVLRGNPARSLYKRLGFRTTHWDALHDYMRLDATAPEPGRDCAAPQIDATPAGARERG